jgi:glutamate-ammonia-ligase adenylyltransferase
MRSRPARARVWDASDFAATTAARSPETLAGLLADDALARAPADGELERLLAEALSELGPDTADERGLARALRRFRRAQMLRIVWRDLAGWADLDETLESLSALADACVRAALDLLTTWTEAELGVPRDAAWPPPAPAGDRHGQARRARAEPVVGHRPDLCLSAHRQHRRRPA